MKRRDWLLRRTWRWARPCSAGAALAQQINIAIATGGTGGVYYPLGGGMANVLSKYVPGVAGDRARHRRLGRQSQADRLAAERGRAGDGRRRARRAQGRGQVQGQPVEVRTLMVLYPNRMHVVSIEGTGIEKMSDLKGKRVSTGSPGSATEVMAFRVIEAAGLDKDKDMRRERLGVAESTNALKDGKIDAFFWVGGLPTAAVTDLGATPGVKIKLIDHTEVVDKMNAKYGSLYTTGVIPAKTYPGQDKDNKIAVVQNILVANAKMSDKVAYDIVKTLHREARRARRRARRSREHRARQPDQQELADPVASGRGEVFQGKGREDVTPTHILRASWPGCVPAMYVWAEIAPWRGNGRERRRRRRRADAAVLASGGILLMTIGGFGFGIARRQAAVRRRASGSSARDVLHPGRPCAACAARPAAPAGAGGDFRSCAGCSDAASGLRAVSRRKFHRRAICCHSVPVRPH